MPKKITIRDLERRIVALESVVTNLTAESTREHRDVPSGKFASIGGIERRGPTTHEKSKKPIDFSHIGGKRVR
jgi:hypothetical protein